MGCKCHSCVVAVLNRSWIQGRGSVVSETAVCEGLELYMMWPELSVGVVAAISPRHSHNFEGDILQPARSGILTDISAGLESFFSQPGTPLKCGGHVLHLCVYVCTFATKARNGQTGRSIEASSRRTMYVCKAKQYMAVLRVVGGHVAGQESRNDGAVLPLSRLAMPSRRGIFGKHC